MSVISTASLKDQALNFHKMDGKPGKVSLLPTKPLTTQWDLSLAYSPGVAAPCLAIKADPLTVFEYTAKGNYVAVISNGTAVLGLGNIGPLASKPVMEGKSVLFKRFADIDSVDIEVDTENIEEFINVVRHLGPSWGGINLEDIRGPDCFIIEKRLIELMDIPVFHDDQHGTAVVGGAGLQNALDIIGKELGSVKIVMNGAGAAGIACAEYFRMMGARHITMVDLYGVVYIGRQEDMNEWKEQFATNTTDRTLAEAMKDADVFIGLSARDLLNEDMLRSMAKDPIIFALANPDPEVRPEFARAIRPDAIIATGRSDEPNQVNNVMGFPYIFRGALDVRARKINVPMKIAASRAIAALAREPVPEDIIAAYNGRQMSFGRDYIIPTPFDQRLLTIVPIAVAKAAIETGVARVKISDWNGYEDQLRRRMMSELDILQMMSKRRTIFS